MPFCSRRTWKTPSGFTTWPTPRCYDDGVVLPRFQSHTHTGKTTGVYHDNHPDTAPDAGLRVPLLTRHHPGCCPTFIPAFTEVLERVLGSRADGRLKELISLFLGYGPLDSVRCLGASDQRATL